MDIRVLRYFLVVAREESITKAAQVLCMSQPPLSRQLKNLEDELGKQLFIRGNKKITLTEDGVLLKKRAEEMISLMEKTMAELGGLEETITGDVYIGSGETEGCSFLAAAAQKIQQIHPQIRYRLYSGDAERVQERLDKGLIDFGLFVGSVDVEKYDYLRLPVTDTWGVLMRKDSPLAAKKNICISDFHGQPLIIPHQVSNSRDITSWLQTDISKLDIVATYDLIYNASFFAKKGIGYAITIKNLINTSGNSELCFRPLYPPLETGVCIAWKRHQVFSKASNEFLIQLRSICENPEHQI